MTDDADGSIEAGPEPELPPDAELRTFLIADVRGYTSFTQRYGDERAAKLAGKFARVARDVVESHLGTVLELRGDEALCVFVSPRQAVRAAMALQRRFVEEALQEPDLPLPVGIGIDVGEAVPVEGGYRSGALNFAARLCSIAKPGEVLASQELTHLARQLEGLSYVVGAPVRLKGLGEPVRPVRVKPDGEDPVAQLVALGAVPPKAPALSGPGWLPPPIRRRPKTAGLAAAVVVGRLATLIVIAGQGSSGLDPLAENVTAGVNPGSGRLVAQTSVGAAPSAIASGAGAVWVTNSADDTVSRLDPRTRGVQQTIQVGSDPRAVAVGGGAVWVANSGSGTVTRIDPEINQVTLTFPVGSGPSALAFGDGALWVADTTGGDLLRVDPATNAVSLAGRVGASPAGVAVAAGHIWVSNSGSGTLSEYDPSAHAVVQTINVGNDPRGLALIGRDLWVANNLDGTVTRIDPKTGTAVATLPVGAGPVAVAEARGSVWVAAETAGQLTRIDAHHNRVQSSVRTGSAPTALAAVGARLWATAAGNPALHRGGTLAATIVSSFELDPAQGYDESSHSIDAMLYDGLLGFRRAPGAAGGTVVPDLAQSLPTVSPDGLTNTFRLRQGIVWSDGKPVTGDDVKRGFERTVAAGTWPLYGGIRGAAKCTTARCDLSAGISSDPAARTVTIRLTGPDPEFLYKAASLGAVAVPADTPLGALGRRTLPSTGPYRVVSATGSKAVTLARNPRFHEWSAAAQPAGYPDRIVIAVHPDEPHQLPAAVIDRSDWTTTLNTPDIPGLRARFGDRVEVSPVAATHELALNTAVPPFNDVRARRAVA
ncbi:MAG: ABC transporter substrate-binding protein, partial [Mycobacteriales bacterium]